MTLYLSSLINIVKVDFNFLFNGTSTSSMTSLLLLAFCALFPIVTFSIIWKNRPIFDSKTFRERYSTLVENLKTNNFWQSLHSTIQVLKWFLTITTLVMLRDYPALQILSNILIQLFFQMYLVWVRPYENWIEQILMTVNEFLVSLYLYIYTLLSDNTSTYDELQDVAGLIQVSIVFFAILINSIFAFGSISLHIFRRIKRFCSKTKNSQQTNLIVASE